MSDAKKEIFLVLRSQSGDKEALDELLRSAQRPLYRYIFRLTGDETLAEDILQEVFVIIYRKIGWLDDPKFFWPWAYRIASRKTFSHLKRERRWREQLRDEETLEQVPDAVAEIKYEPELAAKIPELLSEVSPASRAVLILHYLDEMSLSETAEILGITLGTTKSRLAYGLEIMRRSIKRGQ